MAYKKNYMPSVILSVDESKRVVMYFDLLLALDKRVNKKKAKKKAKTKEAHPEQRSCSPTSSLIFDAFNLVFHKWIIIINRSYNAFIQQAMLHDRYDRSALNTGYV